MPKVKKIICALDFSEHSEKTLAYAAGLAKDLGAELGIVHVIDHLHGFDNFQILALGPDEIAAKLEADASEKMAAQISALDDDFANTEITVRHGKASSQIIEMVKEDGADLIVVGRHGKSGLLHSLVGSVAEAVVRSAACAVLVVK